MTHEKQNVRICLHLGWRFVKHKHLEMYAFCPSEDSRIFNDPDWQIIDNPPADWKDHAAKWDVVIPDWCGSRDHMRTAELSLQGGKRGQYLNLLSDCVGNDQWNGFPEEEPGATDWLWNVHTADPLACARAFCATKNIPWEVEE